MLCERVNRKPGMQLRSAWQLLCVSVLAICTLALPALAQSIQEKGASATSPARSISPYHEVSLPNRAKNYFQSAWGIDDMQVHLTASGVFIRFSYRVTNPVLAKALGDDHSTPYLFGQRSHALLHIPVMDRVGQLRQTGQQEAGREYWMAFSNKGNFVREGDRVNVIIGSFHADGLLVQ
jgi:hypothetical protein